MNLLDSSNNHVQAKALKCICSEAKNMIARLFARASRLKMFPARAAANLPNDNSIPSLLQCLLFLIISLITATTLHQISLSRNFLPTSLFIFNQEDSKRKTHPLSKKRFREKSCIPLSLLRALASHQCGPGSNPGVNAICGLSLLLVLSVVPRGFSPGTPVSPLLKNQHFQIPIRPGIR